MSRAHVTVTDVIIAKVLITQNYFKLGLTSYYNIKYCLTIDPPTINAQLEERAFFAVYSYLLFRILCNRLLESNAAR
jgi:hypothetical protein